MCVLIFLYMCVCVCVQSQPSVKERNNNEYLNDFSLKKFVCTFMKFSQNILRTFITYKVFLIFF